jgi:hypothetical protein
LQKLSGASWAVMTLNDKVKGVWPAGLLAAQASKLPADSPVVVAAGKPPAFAIVPVHATLAEALARLDKAGADAALVIAGAVVRAPYVRGVVGRSQIDRSVRQRS